MKNIAFKEFIKLVQLQLLLVLLLLLLYDYYYYKRILGKLTSLPLCGLFLLGRKS